MGFFDGGTKGASFAEDQGYTVGTTWSGTITKIGEVRQAMSYVRPGSGEVSKPLTFPSGDPIMELPIEIHAEQVTVTSEDDGVRVIFFEGEKKKALIRALRAAGARRDPQVGDWIALRWSGMGGPTGKRKMFEAQFRAGASGAFFEQPAATPVAAPVAPPAPAAPVAPQPQSAQIAAQLQQAPQVAPVAQPARVTPAAEARPPWQTAPVAPAAEAPAAAVGSVW